ncbi:MAG TPA: ECF-type sigma factor [Vicinamibacterales bacterium]|nr:ECF-type sigma factor [Vicinamibacterales bacterium]
MHKPDVSGLLRAWSDGDRGALQALTPVVYEELHRLARRYMRRECSGHSLQATALVNEAYMRLADCTRMQWQDRAHFFAVSAQVMRRILVDHARRRNVKRGRGLHHVSLDDVVVVAAGREAEMDLAALDDALLALAQMDPRKAGIVEMRFFGGLTEEEIGKVLKLSTGTIKREWRAAKAWLHQELTR